MSPEEMRELIKEFGSPAQYFQTEAGVAAKIVKAIPLFLKELEELRVENMCLKNNLLHPPEPWTTFGAHVDDDIPLVFWGEDWDYEELPLWERPA